MSSLYCSLFLFRFHLFLFLLLLTVFRHLTLPTIIFFSCFLVSLVVSLFYFSVSIAFLLSSLLLFQKRKNYSEGTPDNQCRIRSPRDEGANGQRRIRAIVIRTWLNISRFGSVEAEIITTGQSPAVQEPFAWPGSKRTRHFTVGAAINVAAMTGSTWPVTSPGGGRKMGQFKAFYGRVLVKRGRPTA